MAKRPTTAAEPADTAPAPAAAAAPAETPDATPDASADEAPATPRFFLVLSPLLLDGALHDIGDRVGLFPAEIPALQAAGVLGEDVTADS
ncbi:hypothetical protein CCR97_25885 [Rhodoplanes elegans]|uniref:Uncharacterized protein n=1 Tax=Rhodoplanes elegans TaxID=29408 RepID=A0A327JLC0_9BRAD|nr:hypothetical protein [Rhodoplanes elegans]MBK5961610.1 hypothetical protein [Rhodoplanes elegans]RAI26113.1 hypothetical protein CH338_30950 [Rhodoplanes elegans]